MRSTSAPRRSPRSTSSRPCWPSRRTCCPQFRRHGVGSRPHRGRRPLRRGPGHRHHLHGRGRQLARRQPLHGPAVVHPAGHPAGRDHGRRTRRSSPPAARRALGHPAGRLPPHRPGARGTAHQPRERRRLTDAAPQGRRTRGQRPPQRAGISAQVIREVHTRLPRSSVITTSQVAMLRPRCAGVATPVTVPDVAERWWVALMSTPTAIRSGRGGDGRADRAQALGQHDGRPAVEQSVGLGVALDRHRPDDPLGADLGDLDAHRVVERAHALRHAGDELVDVDGGGVRGGLVGHARPLWPTPRGRRREASYDG